MPIFEYLCTNCGRHFEHLQLSVGQNNVACPACVSQDVEKQFSSFATPKGGAYCPTSCESAGSGCCGSSGRKCFE